MATTYQALSFADVPVHLHNRLISRISRSQTFTLSTLNDKVQFFRLPAKGFKIQSVGIITDSLDSNASKTVNLDVVLTRNDGGTEYSLITGSQIGRAGGVASAWAANSAGFLTYLKAGVLKGERLGGRGPRERGPRDSCRGQPPAHAGSTPATPRPVS
jgi:hypothetical protein